MHIVHNCNGSHTTVVLEPKEIDEKQSMVWSGSTYLKYQDGQEVTTGKESDDKIVLGYTYDGLPFQMVVDGMFGCDNKKTQAFIDESVVPLIDYYAGALSIAANNPEQVTKDFIEKLRTIRPDLQGIEFTLSLAVTYEREGLLFCSGFGIGDTGIVLKRSNGIIDQLVTNNEVNGFKDAVDDNTAELPINELMQRNTLFTTTVTEGDELVGYTWVDDSLEKVQEMKEVVDMKNKSVEVRKMGLDIASLQDSTLYDYILKKNLECLEVRKMDKKSGGDDATFGRIVIPRAKLRQELKQVLRELEILQTQIKDDKLQSKVMAVYDAAKVLINSGKKTDAVLQQVELTNQLLKSSPGKNREELLQKYLKNAEKYNKEQASIYEKALGVAMMALGHAIRIVAINVFILSVGRSGTDLFSQSIGVYKSGLGLFNNQKEKDFASAVKAHIKTVQDEPDEEDKPQDNAPGNN